MYVFKPLSNNELNKIFSNDIIESLRNNIDKYANENFTENYNSIPPQLLENWFSEFLKVENISTNYPIDILKPNEWGADIKVMKYLTDDNGNLTNASSPIFLAQQFKPTEISLEKMFSNGEFSKIIDSWINTLFTKLNEVKKEKNINKIYYFFFLRGNPKENYICAFEVDIDKINIQNITQRDKDNAIGNTIFLNGLIDSKYGRTKIFKNRLELVLKPKALYDDKLLITLPLNIKQSITKKTNISNSELPNFFSIKFSRENDIKELLNFYKEKNKEKVFKIDGLTHHLKDVNIDDVVFIVAGGWQSAISFDYIQGLYGIAKVIEKPYNIKGRSYDIDVQFTYFFEKVIMRDDFDDYKKTKNIPYIGMMSKGEKTQAISKIDFEQVKAVLDASFKITKQPIQLLNTLFTWFKNKPITASSEEYNSLIDKLPPALNVVEIAKVFANYLINYSSDKTSTIIGIFGKWGRGKTYFFEQIKEYILSKNNKTKKFYFCEFQPWKYQKSESAWAYLYQTILNSYLEKNINYKYEWIKKFDNFLSNYFEFKPIQKFINIFKLNLNRLGWFKLLTPTLSIVFSAIWIFTPLSEKFNISISIIGMLGIIGLLYIYNTYTFIVKNKNVVKSIINSYAKIKDYAHYLGFQNEIQNELKTLLETFIDKDKEKLIIFVDDLDRCNEKMIIDIMDSLRLMLDEENINLRVSIITAIDERILKKSIKHKYFDSNDEIINDDKIKEYIEKFFLMGIKLNQLNDSDIEDLVINYTNAINSIKNESVENADVESENVKKENTDIESENAEKENTDIESKNVEKENTDIESKNVEKENTDIESKNVEKENTDIESKNVENNDSKNIVVINSEEIEYLTKKLQVKKLDTPRKINILIHRYLLFKSLALTMFNNNEFNNFGIEFLIDLVVSSQDEEKLKEFIKYYDNNKTNRINLPIEEHKEKDIDIDNYIILVKFAEMVSPF